MIPRRRLWSKFVHAPITVDRFLFVAPGRYSFSSAGFWADLAVFTSHSCTSSTILKR